MAELPSLVFPDTPLFQDFFLLLRVRLVPNRAERIILEMTELPPSFSPRFRFCNSAFCSSVYVISATDMIPCGHILECLVLALATATPAAYRRGLLPNANRAEQMSVRLRNAEWTQVAFQRVFANKLAFLQSLGGPGRLGGIGLAQFRLASA